MHLYQWHVQKAIRSTDAEDGTHGSWSRQASRVLGGKFSLDLGASVETTWSHRYQTHPPTHQTAVRRYRYKNAGRHQLASSRQMDGSLDERLNMSRLNLSARFQTTRCTVTELAQVDTDWRKDVDGWVRLLSETSLSVDFVSWLLIVAKRYVEYMAHRNSNIRRNFMQRKIRQFEMH